MRPCRSSLPRANPTIEEAIEEVSHLFLLDIYSDELIKFILFFFIKIKDEVATEVCKY